MASLSTLYLGLQLDSPLIAASSPLSRDIAGVRRLEDAGAGAIVLFSLFQEQLADDLPLPGNAAMRCQLETSVAAKPRPAAFAMEPGRYLDHIAAAKAAVDVPIIASLNVARPDRWIAQARLMQEAGADAVELDVYTIPCDPTLTGGHIEEVYLEILREVKAGIDIPVAVKLCPFFSSLPAFTQRLDEAGADAIVLFNRLYQPSIDVENRTMVMRADLSSSHDSHLAVQWIAILHGQLRSALAATGGMHTAEDAVRALMAGADVVAMCSALLIHGIDHLAEVRCGLSQWLDEHGAAATDEIRGVMSMVHYSDPEDFKRAGYAKVLRRFW